MQPFSPANFATALGHERFNDGPHGRHSAVTMDFDLVVVAAANDQFFSIGPAPFSDGDPFKRRVRERSAAIRDKALAHGADGVRPRDENHGHGPAPWRC
jgi:hypothetical protein